MSGRPIKRTLRGHDDGDGVRLPRGEAAEEIGRAIPRHRTEGKQVGHGGLRGDQPTRCCSEREGIDAPICQDTRSGRLDDLLASAKIGHAALVDLASEATFQAPDDLSLGSAVRRAACDVIKGRLMVPHADDDGSIERCWLSVAATIEAVPASGHPG